MCSCCLEFESNCIQQRNRINNDSEENSIGGRPYPRTEAPGAETLEKNIGDSVENSIGGRPQKLLVYKRLLLYSIDDSVENSMGGGHTLGQKLLVQKLLRL